ncbi:hypothetical protein GLOTRDRAFT_130873 [Gloeophyllum trabeum ATCC 11539]|uniref:Uncharacterized protein n=1 Tax=Gloeophyllum trabeum (strain ATCC 11539 / FP-39264 / Madison 617) TaxID=670483 RepID=S7RH31_GLOTA|nr:uncharacterized protein GLOTRDRAFT_130873 [Gloeophyllum trabeum ATCC 11539]EPQ53530.1 hypothetical protein GLOTRDRAFT_130873 [Gloeophyllum trabeum ATCC 11539]
MLIALATVLAAVSCWAILGGTTSAASKESGCHIDTSLDAGIHQATAWEALFIYDVFVFVLTVLRTWRAPSMHLRSLTGRVSLVRVLLRDGAIYFTVMAAANLANILTFYLADDALRGVLSTFASSISVVMASRLMLNLYQAAEPPESNSRDISWAPPSTGTMSISIRLVSPRTPRLGPRLESQRGIEDVELRDIGEVRRDPECAVDRR